ncbi:hypothetical protein LPJGGPFB_02571 [Ensifer adhaerens]|nr:hypothetical protein [Ensifer adhaerens]
MHLLSRLKCGAFTLLCVLGSPLSAAAQNCNGGGLSYLGNIRDGSNSVWLSGTPAGSFSLESAQGNQTVDTWSKSRRGLHLSVSPFVSQGNGGTHKLYDVSDGKPCLIDTQNQKRDFTLPPNINMPSIVMPGRVVPPIGNIFPDFAPPASITPPIGNLPSGVTPPIGSLPGGVTPPIGSLPGGVTPPIGSLPGGVTPPIGSLPGGVTPPIGSLPGGVTPPIGSLPGGVTPPIGSLPGGVAPPIASLPGVVAPPIGSLPGGVTPPIGRVPGGVAPPIGSLPGGATPPIGSLPGGVSPPIGSVPGGVQPPIGTLPGGVAPPGGTLPGGVQPPIVIVRSDGGNLKIATDTRVSAQQSAYYCIDPRSQPQTRDDERMQLPICSREVLAEAARQQEARLNQVPLTEGRDFGQQTLWNFRMGGRVMGISDERFGLDIDTTLRNATFALDRRLNDDVVVGMTFTIEASESDGFGDDLQVNTNGFSVGPYIATRLSPQWALDSSLTYGRYDNDLELSILDGSFTSERYSAELNLHGQYKWDEYFVRPKVTASFSHIANDAYSLTGDIFSLPIDVALPGESFNYGYIEATTEVSRFFEAPGGTPFLAFAEVGAKYEYERPNDGQILTGDLSLATPSPWSFSLRSGVRMLITNALQLEASAGYLSFGQANLDVWDCKLDLSVSF